MLCTVNQLKAIPVARKGTSRDSQVGKICNHGENEKSKCSCCDVDRI